MVSQSDRGFKFHHFQLVVGLLGGGVGAALLNHFVLSRPEPTVITYKVTTTSIGPATLDLPNLRILVNGKPVPAISTHVVEFGMQQGPFLESIGIDIAFAPSVKLMGSSDTAIRAGLPDHSHSLTCQDTSPTGDTRTVLHCKMGPFNRGQNPFKLTIFTNRSEPPEISTSADQTKTKLIPLTAFAPGPDHVVLGFRITRTSVIVLIIIGVGIAVLSTVLGRPRRIGADPSDSRQDASASEQS